MANNVTLFTEMVKQKFNPMLGLLALFTSKPSNIFNGTTVEYDKVRSKRLTALAKERGSSATKNGSENYTKEKFDPPTYKEERPYDIDNFEQTVAGQNIYDDKEKEVLIMDKTSDDLVMLDNKIVRAMLLQAAYIFQTGGIPFKTNNLTVENVPDIDFGTPTALLADLTGGAGSLYWDNASADPIKNMEDRIRLIEKEGGERVRDVIFGSSALAAMLDNSKVQAQLDVRRMERGSLTFGDRDDMGMSVIGFFNLNNRTVRFLSYEDYYLDPADDTTMKEYIDPKNVVFIAEGSYEIFYAGIKVIKDVKPLGFLGTNNIRQMGTTIASSAYIDTHVDNNNENVWLRLQKAPLLVPKTNDTFGKMKVLA